MAADNDECPFCTISGDLPHPFLENKRRNEDNPTFVVASTPEAIAFLDRLPLTKCHTLVIPRDHYEMLSDVPAETAAEVGRILPAVCRAVMEVSGADGFNVVQNNGLLAVCPSRNADCEVSMRDR